MSKLTKTIINIIYSKDQKHNKLLFTNINESPKIIINSEAKNELNKLWHYGYKTFITIQKLMFKSYIEIKYSSFSKHFDTADELEPKIDTNIIAIYFNEYNITVLLINSDQTFNLNDPESLDQIDRYLINLINNTNHINNYSVFP